MERIGRSVETKEGNNRKECRNEGRKIKEKWTEGTEGENNRNECSNERDENKEKYRNEY